jgi:hypothetical protein
MKRFLLGPIVAAQLFTSTAFASPKGLADFARAQTDLRISFTKCVMLIQLYVLSADNKKLDDAANCVTHFKTAVMTAANDYKKTTANAEAHALIDIWGNQYTDAVNIAIKHPRDDHMFEGVLNLVSDADKLIYSKIKDTEMKKSFADKVLEADKDNKWPDGSPIIPTNPDLEASPKR